MKQHVLYVVRPATGGIRSHLIALLTHLSRDKWIPVVAATDGFLETLPKNIPPYVAVSLDIASTARLADIETAFDLQRILRTYKGAIIHAHGIRGAFIAALAPMARSRQILTTLHNIAPQTPLAKLALSFIRARSRAVICVSNAVAASANTANAEIISNGVQVAKFAAPSRDLSRQSFGLAPGEFVVATASRLSPEKGIDVLLDAARLTPEITYLIAGAGPDGPMLTASAPKNVTLLGPIPDVAPLFRAADLVVMPSRSEGQGITALEAMAAGTPVVASDVGGLKETITAEVNGLLVPPESAGDLANAVRRLSSNRELLGALGKNAADYAIKSGDVKTMMARIEQVYAKFGS